MQKRFVFINVFLLVTAVVALTALGIVMLTSTGAYAKDAHGKQFYFLKQQLISLGIGAVACVIAAIVDYRRLEKKWWVLYASAAVLLVCCFVPHLGINRNGASRWVGIGGRQFQPSELGKLAVLVMLAWWYAQRNTDPKSFLRGFIFPLALAGGIIGLIAPEVDLGTSALIGCTAMLIMYVAGVRIVYLLLLGAAGATGLYTIIKLMPERVGRLKAFLEPQIYKDDAYQQMQAQIAFGNGGVDGLGLGNGRQKLNYLPEAHTDFILPSIGEEMGLWYTLGIVFCYLLLLVAGVVIATRARERFGKLLGFGIVTLLAVQAAINIGVTTMCLPNKGLPLPFISYGGSNLIFCLVGIGILISIYRQGNGETRDPGATFFQVKAKKGVSPRM
jgi:cell division protein FtsW